jgi:hypothetical protein
MRFRIAVTACSAMITGVAAALIATQQPAGAMPMSDDWGCGVGPPVGCWPGGVCCMLGHWTGTLCDEDSMEVTDCCYTPDC